MQRNRFIDNLRGISVLGVFFFHIVLIWKNFSFNVNPEQAELGIIGEFFLYFGAYGVDVFFTLSGFLIAGSLERSRDYKRFYLKRFARIFPIYYATYIFSAIAMTASYYTAIEPNANQIRINSWHLDNIPYYLTFMASYRPHFGEDLAGHLWSLAVEEHFYLAFPILFALAKKQMAKMSLVIFAVFFFWRGYVCFFSEIVYFDVLYHHSHFRMLGILMGVILFYYIDWFKGKAIFALYLVAAVVFYVSYDSLYPGQSYQASSVDFAKQLTEWLKHFIPSLGVMILIANFKDLKITAPWLKLNEFVGKASLSFYIVSYIVNGLVAVVLAGLQLWNFWIYLVVVIILTGLISTLFYKFFERWLYEKIIRR